MTYDQITPIAWFIDGASNTILVAEDAGRSEYYIPAASSNRPAFLGRKGVGLTPTARSPLTVRFQTAPSLVPRPRSQLVAR